MVEIDRIRYYTPKEVANALTVSIKTVYSWIKNNKLKYQPYLINRILISETELQKFAKKHGWSWIYQ